MVLQFAQPYSSLPHSSLQYHSIDSATKSANDGQSAGRRSPNHTTKTAGKRRGSSGDYRGTSSNSGGGGSDNDSDSDSDSESDSEGGGGGGDESSAMREESYRALELIEAAKHSTTPGERERKNAQVHPPASSDLIPI